MRREFFSRVAGTSHANDDGTSRQLIIAAEARAGDRLRLQFDDTNPVDRCAVAVLLPSSRQLGYLVRRLAFDVRGWVDDGDSVDAAIANITGGSGDRLFGVNIIVTVTGPERPPRRGVAALNRDQAVAEAAGNEAELEALLIEEMDMRERDGRVFKTPIRPPAHERLAALYSKQGRRPEEITILQRYCGLPTAMSEHRHRLLRRLDRLHRQPEV